MSSRKGWPSRGCQMCRARKVGCDEATPTCSRCAKAGHQCKYRDASELFFRHQNEVTAKKAQNRWRGRATKPTISIDLETREGDQNPMPNSLEGSRTGEVPRSLDLPLHELAVGRFFQDYVVSNDPLDRRKGFLEFLPDLYASSSSDSCLSATVSAIAYANFGGRFQMAEAKSSAAKSYGTALKLINVAIADPEEAKSDETLLAVYLTSVYEVIKHADFNPGSWMAHSNGAVALLRLRGQQQFMSSTGARLFGMIITQMLIVCLKTGQRPALPLETWVGFFDPYAPGFRLIALIYHAADQCAVIRDLIGQALHKRSGSIAEAEALMTDARRLDGEFEEWATNMPVVWDFRTIDIIGRDPPKWSQLFMNCVGRPSIVHTYRSLSVASGWNLFRVTRLVLNQSIVDCASWCMTRSTDQTAQTHQDISPENDLQTMQSHLALSTNNITKMIEEICASVFSHLHISIEGKLNPATSRDVCAVRGLLLLWPLSTAASCMVDVAEGTQEEKMRSSWLKAVLTFISQDLSIAQASACKTA